MLERHQYSQAHETFKEAAIAMREASLCCGGGNDSTDNDTKRDFSLVTLLQTAYKRLSEPKVSEPPQDLQVITQCDRLSNILSTLNLQPASSAAFPIRIDAEVDGVEDLDMNIKSAIIAYNFGIAQLCRAKTAKKQQTVEGLRESALNVFLRAKTILSNCKEDGKLSRVLLVGIAILHTIIVTQCEAGKVAEAREGIQRLMCMRMAAEVYVQDMENITDIPCCAAAA